MPSPINKKGYYKNKNGAWVKIKGEYCKVGKNKRKNMLHYSKKNSAKDRTRRARKTTSTKRKRYPHHFD